MVRPGFRVCDAIPCRYTRAMRMAPPVPSTFLLPRYAYLAARHAGRCRKDAQAAHGRGARHQSELRFSAYVRSKTLFVLGSGASINQLTPEQWAHIRACDSIGFDNWLLHEHVPTFLLLEHVPRNDPSHEAVMTAYEHNLQVARERYRDVPIFASLSDTKCFDVARLPAELRNNLHLLTTLQLYGQREDDVRTQLRFYGRLGWLAPTETFRTSLTKRSAWLRILHFAVLAGYRQIVLCGVDGDDAPRFFQADPGSYRRAGYRLDHVATQQGAESKLASLSLDECAAVLPDGVLSPRGIALSVVGPCSKRLPRLPVYEFDAAKV